MLDWGKRHHLPLSAAFLPPRRLRPSVSTRSGSRALQRCPRRGATPPRTSCKVGKEVGGEGVSGCDICYILEI